MEEDENFPYRFENQRDPVRHCGFGIYYNSSHQGCCGTKHRYNLRTQQCCNGTVVSLFYLKCCNDGSVASRNSSCSLPTKCGIVRYNISDQGCCTGRSRNYVYDLSTQKCCYGRVYSTSFPCLPICGYGFYNASHQGCCDRRNVYY